MQTFIEEINLNFGSILLQITFWVLVGHNEQAILKKQREKERERVQNHRTLALGQASCFVDRDVEVPNF